MRTTFILPDYFARQSIRQRWDRMSRSSRAQLTTALCIGLVVATGLVTATNAHTVADLAFGLGLMAPGAGFIAQVLASGTFDPIALALTFSALAAFVVALLLWFGTGNVLAPPAAWLGAAGLAAWRSGDTQATMWPVEQAMILGIATIMPLLLSAAVALARGAVRPTRDTAELQLRPLVAAPRTGELDLPTLQLQRLLLDRALQPVETFDGFEWRDQFQTAAVRYQLNFVSYALSIVHAHQLPAFSGYMLDAQQRLLAKQSDPRVWRYWAWESAWGHLRRNADPVPRDNIMYTGFVAAQIAMAEAASGRTVADGGPHLRLVAPAGQRFAYKQSDLTGILADQYRRAPWGLLASEPHWIYPLCNLITATALRSHGARAGSSDWDDIAPTFRDGLMRNFTTTNGALVPFRSSLTGLAMPAAGGIVMQAFPCLFLNALFPDLADEHWVRVREKLATQRWSRAFWPVDVGNYGFSRASTLSASAAAAVEMGDDENAQAMLAMLDRECPTTLADGVRHRPRASLWAHALELVARCNHRNGLADLVASSGNHTGPHIAHAPYPDVLVARAELKDDRLEIVLYPGEANGERTLTLAGLRPRRHYRVEGSVASFLRADDRGTADLAVPVIGRTALSVFPVV